MSPRVVQKPQESAEQRRQELAAASVRLDEAAALRPIVANMHEDVAQMEAKRDRLAEVGGQRLEIARESFDQRYRVQVEWQPIYSRLTGAELAAAVEAETVPLRQEIKALEARIAELLA